MSSGVSLTSNAALMVSCHAQAVGGGRGANSSILSTWRSFTNLGRLHENPFITGQINCHALILLD